MHKKTFDVVNYTKLKIKIYLTGMKGNMWQLIDDLYMDSNEVDEKETSAISTQSTRVCIRAGCPQKTSTSCT